MTNIFRICKFILPCNQRLILDPDNITHPSCFEREEYGETLALLQTCRQIRNEVLPALYFRNTITIINAAAMSEVPDPLETSVGSRAYNEIKSLEFGMSKGLEELGHLWSDTLCLPKLEQLKLVFYHGDALAWMKQMTELTVAMTYETQSIEELASSEGLELRVELFESVAVPRYGAPTYTTKINEYKSRAKTRSHAYRFVLPRKLKAIIISASVSPQAAFAFATYRHHGWRFNSPPAPSTDTHHRKTLVWEKEHKEIEDTAL